MFVIEVSYRSLHPGYVKFRLNLGDGQLPKGCYKTRGRGPHAKGCSSIQLFLAYILNRANGQKLVFGLVYILISEKNVNKSFLNSINPKLSPVN